MTEKLWLLEITCSCADYDRLIGLISSEAQYGWEEDDMSDDRFVLRIYNRDKKRLDYTAALVDETGLNCECEIKEIKEKDWSRAWREYFTPVLCGTRLVVLPPWLADREYKGRKAIIIDPKNAFGTGHHASTMLCLTALSNLLDEGRLKKGQWFLDIGCGSGILSIAAEKAGLNGTALDIDEDAIINARENRELNEADSLEVIKGSVEMVKGDRYNLIMANILAKPLVKMAPQITALMEKNGILILSGILASQMRDVIDAYISCGLSEPDILQDGEWAALIWK